MPDWLLLLGFLGTCVVPIGGTIWAIGGGGHLRALRQAWSELNARNPDRDASEAEVSKQAAMILVRIAAVWGLAWLILEVLSRLR